MTLRCDDCGKFMSEVGSWAAIYDFVGMQLDHEHIRCKVCTQKIGPVHSNAMPADGNMSRYEGVLENGKA